MKKLLFVFILLFLQFSFCLQASENIKADKWKKIKSTGEGDITIYYFEVDAFIIENKKGKPEGIEYELINGFVKFLENKYKVQINVHFVKIDVFQDFYNNVKYGVDGVFGVASISITDKRKLEIQFSPPYIPDIEVLICSDNVPIVTSKGEFKKILKDLKALNVANTTFDINFKKLRNSDFPLLNIENVANSNEIRRRISSEPNLIGYSELPTYFLAIKNGLRIKRQFLFTVQRTGYGIMFPLESDWTIPVNEFFDNNEFKPFVNNLIKKHFGSGVKDLLWAVAEKDTPEMSKEILLLAKEKEIQNLQITKKDLELNKQRALNYFVFTVLFLMMVLAFFIYRGYRNKQKANKLLAAQKQVIEAKNKDITDSIRYGESIQAAILPTDEQIKQLLPESFVLFKPKDIVSGDFYWITSPTTPSLRDEVVIFAACDSTGHGVPGAFMSMICTSLLNEIVNDNGITKPSEIFYEVRKGIITSLKQKGESGQKDGMDAVLCAWDKKNNTLEFAVANNPLWIIRKNDVPLKNDKGEEIDPHIQEKDISLYQIKPDKQPVGFLTGKQQPFTHHKINLEKGDTIYIFSDGYQDQFGGPRGKKFRPKQFRELLLSIQDKSMEEQEEILDKTIEEWKGNQEQVDDILVIGVRV